MVAGGAGLVGSHLCELLLRRGHEVICVDSFVTSSSRNVEELLDCDRFTLLEHDVLDPLEVEADNVFHLASPASPIDFAEIPETILRTNSIGTLNLLELAERTQARFVFASTSEVYGSPLEHPQRELYWGNVNPIGPRSCYDESKRFGEACTMSAHQSRNVNARIVRIFNTYGPRMRVGDGRASVEFISRALRNEPLVVLGDGRQTRSWCYVGDLVRGILRAVTTPQSRGMVFNLGNPVEISIRSFAEQIIRLAGSTSVIEYQSARTDDPVRRCPDISRAREILGWEPVVALDEGLRETIDWYRQHVS